jgi:hypothetical protein
MSPREVRTYIFLTLAQGRVNLNVLSRARFLGFSDGVGQGQGQGQGQGHSNRAELPGKLRSYSQILDLPEKSRQKHLGLSAKMSFITLTVHVNVLRFSFIITNCRGNKLGCLYLMTYFSIVSYAPAYPSGTAKRCSISKG